MSDKTPDVDNIEKNPSTEAPEVKIETPSPKETENKYEGLTSEQLLEKLQEKEKIIQDKHNMGLSAQDKLKTYQEQEEAERVKKLEDEGNYKALIDETKTFREQKDAETKTLAEELAALKAKNEAYEKRELQNALAGIPEERVALVTSIAENFSGDERINKINELKEAFGVPATSFGGPVGAKKVVKKGSEFEILKDKVLKGEATAKEMKEYRKLKNDQK